jgi:hypothetical protein
LRIHLFAWKLKTVLKEKGRIKTHVKRNQNCRTWSNIVFSIISLFLLSKSSLLSSDSFSFKFNRPFKQLTTEKMKNYKHTDFPKWRFQSQINTVQITHLVKSFFLSTTRPNSQWYISTNSKRFPDSVNLTIETLLKISEMPSAHTHFINKLLLLFVNKLIPSYLHIINQIFNLRFFGMHSFFNPIQS